MMLDADKLKRVRKVAGLTQEQLAQTLGVSRQTVSSWENGRSLPDEANLLRLARALHTDPEQFAPDSSETFEPPVSTEPSVSLEGHDSPVPSEPADSSAPSASSAGEPATSSASESRKRSVRFVCMGLAVLLLAVGLWCLLRPRGISSPLRPQDFQQSYENACLALSPMESSLFPRQTPYGSERFWRLNVYVQASMEGDCTIQELRFYRYGRDWLGRISLREVFSSPVDRLRSFWGTNVARAGQSMNYVTSASVEADDYGFGIEAVGRSSQGQPYAVRTWVDCSLP